MRPLFVRNPISANTLVTIACVALAIFVGTTAALYKQSKYDKAAAFDAICGQLDAQPTTAENEPLKEICNSSRKGVDAAKSSR